MVIIGCATAFTKILTIEKIPGAITNGIINFTDNKILILLLINVLLLIVGCFMDTTPAMMVLAPILLPIAMQFGVDPIHFGIVMVVNLAIGFITPPLGINLFVASRVGRSDLETVCSGIIKFILVMVVDLLLILNYSWISIRPNNCTMSSKIDSGSSNYSEIICQKGIKSLWQFLEELFSCQGSLIVAIPAVHTVC